jgi:flagellar basal-body rod modification protein FlgD
MTVDAASSAASSAAASTDTVGLGRTRLAQSFDTFLTLLTAQMKNQDPLSPLDSNQFTAQLVQMTGVEQQLATNDLLKQLVSNTGTNLASAVDVIGKQVRANDAGAKLADGKAQWTYHLDTDVSDLKIEVLNDKGQTVDVIAPAAGDTAAGEHTLAWNGRNLAGLTQPDGVYTLRLTSKTASGDTVSVGQVYIDAPATAVEQSDGQTLVTINGVRVPLSEIVSIAQSPSTASSGSGAGADTTNPADGTSIPGA